MFFVHVVVGKDLDADRELEGNLEWKDRVEKWKAKQEKRGLISKDDGGDNDNEEDDVL